MLGPQLVGACDILGRVQGVPWEVEGGVGVGSLAAECPQSGESVSLLSGGLLTGDVRRSEDAPQRGWGGCQGRDRACGAGARRQDRRPRTPCLWAEGSLFSHSPLGADMTPTGSRGPRFWRLREAPVGSETGVDAQQVALLCLGPAGG